MKKFTVIRKSKGCIDGVDDRIMDGYVFDGIADYDESKKVDTDGFYDGWDGKICKDENGELYLVDFHWETKEPLIWCKIKEDPSVLIGDKFLNCSPEKLERGYVTHMLTNEKNEIYGMNFSQMINWKNKVEMSHSFYWSEVYVEPNHFAKIIRSGKLLVNPSAAEIEIYFRQSKVNYQGSIKNVKNQLVEYGWAFTEKK